MRIVLLGKRKLGFVTGTCKKESYKTTDLQEQWETCNAIILSWIMNNMCEELLGGIVYASYAHLVWEDLLERFDKVNRARRQILMKTTAPTLNQAYAMIVWDESQQNLGANVVTDRGDPTLAMQATSRG
ncbi:uncharacterized protein LOC142176997 [Nicotiana tabacum]|uniref:Uncharacterized protein LOC142176997 n=1 Tax=Nicotiana tabacum TaxID=4097 RepID=A0AC58TW16_TOBAC